MTAHQTLLFCFVQAAGPASIKGNNIQNVYVKILLSFNLNMLRSVTPMRVTETEFQKSKYNHLSCNTRFMCYAQKSVQKAKAWVFSFHWKHYIYSYSFMRQQLSYCLYGQHNHHFCKILMFLCVTTNIIIICIIIQCLYVFQM
jgi:hypothetical protein